MCLRRLWLAVPVSIALQTILFGQTSAPPRRVRLSIKSLPPPAAPHDPLELVAGGAQPVQNAEQRQAAVNLLETAHALSNVRAQPYDLKTTFTSSGSSASDGAWSLEDTSPSRGLYRWTAQGPGYSAINLYINKVLYSNQPATAVPLRLAQVRTAIFFMYAPVGPRASIRTATGVLNGAGFKCILVNRGMHAKAEPGGRGWDEVESCIDPASGLLTTDSPVPSLYILYDYSNALHFHGKIIPGKFTITEAGHPVIQARVESVADPAKADPALFEPNGLNQVGVGALMTPPWRVRSFVPSPNGAGTQMTTQAVALHGMLSPQGVLSETEILATI